jgi:ABC-type multidrug transport system fused ATPase/permease subunit
LKVQQQMKQILKNTLSILNSGEKKKFIFFIALQVFISLIDIASLALLVFLISFYTQGDLHPRLAPDMRLLHDTNSVLPISIFLFLFILKSIFGYLLLDAQFKYVYSVASRISRFNLMKYLNGSYSDYVHHDSSVYVRKILHQPIEFCHYVLAGIQQIITESILSLLTIVVVLVFNAKLFLLLSLVLLPPVFMIAYLTKRKLKNARLHVKSNSEKTLQHLHEALGGYIESNIFGKSNFFAGRFSLLQRRMTGYLADIQTNQSAPARLIEVFAVLGLFILILANKFSDNAATVEIINIGAFMAAAYKIIPGIVKISNVSGQIKTYEYTVNDLVQNTYSEKRKEIKSQRIESLAFNKISYSRDNKIILDQFDFTVGKGDFAGMSGPSGKGKTTFINLLLGFMSQNEGDILINGTIAGTDSRQHFWKDISYVQQRPFLIHDTLRANITLGDGDGDIVKLKEIIDSVGLSDFVGQFPEGLNRVITENGKNISGGQRQRISVARALYKDAGLIILDEPFSELDTHSEERIIAYLLQLQKKGKMIILITHKRDNLLYCNKTYFIE